MKMRLLAGTLHNIAESPQNGSFFVPGFVRPGLNFAISKRSVTLVNTSADEMPVRAQSSSRSQLRYGNAFPNGSDTTRTSVRRTHPCCVSLSNAILHALFGVPVYAVSLSKGEMRIRIPVSIFSIVGAGILRLAK
jgi:hypothetical protein